MWCPIAVWRGLSGSRWNGGRKVLTSRCLSVRRLRMSRITGGPTSTTGPRHTAIGHHIRRLRPVQHVASRVQAALAAGAKLRFPPAPLDFVADRVHFFYNQIFHQIVNFVISQQRFHNEPPFISGYPRLFSITLDNRLEESIADSPGLCPQKNVLRAMF